MSQPMPQPLIKQIEPQPLIRQTTQPRLIEPPEPEYPTSDGEPMAETDEHVDEMLALRDTLKHFFRHEADVYVAGNNFIYYVKGNPRKVFSPDTYVVRGVAKRQRPYFRTWEEKQVPCFVMEMSSRRTWRYDKSGKKALCARLGVAEYFLYDPQCDVLKPALQGYRRRPGRAQYARIAPEADGSVLSEQLGLKLWLDEQLRLRCTDPVTGRTLRRSDEAQLEADRAEEEKKRADLAEQRADEEKRRADAVSAKAARVDAAEQRADEEKRRADEEKRRADAAERELARLRAELAKRGGGPLS